MSEDFTLVNPESVEPFDYGPIHPYFCDDDFDIELWVNMLADAMIENWYFEAICNADAEEALMLKARRSKRRKQNLMHKNCDYGFRHITKSGHPGHMYRAWEHSERERHLKVVRAKDYNDQLEEYYFPDDIDSKDTFVEECKYLMTTAQEKNYLLDKNFLLKRLEYYCMTNNYSETEGILLKMLNAFMSYASIWKYGIIYEGFEYFTLNFFREPFIQNVLNAIGFQIEFINSWENSEMHYRYIGDDIDEN